MGRNSAFFLLVLCVLVLACQSHKEVSLEDVRQYMLEESNGLYKKIEIGKTKFEAFYKPTDLLVGQDMGETKNGQKAKQLYGDYAKQLYFVVNIGHDGKDMEWYTAHLKEQSLASDLGPYFQLYADEGREIALKGYIMPTLAGVSDKSTFLLAFDEAPKKSEKLTLHIDEMGFETGEVKFDFKVEDLARVPKINWK